MPFPLPNDIQFRQEVIQAWLEDINDRIELGQIDQAELSWKQATGLYLKLGHEGYRKDLDDQIVEARVKLDRFTQQLLCEQSQKTSDK
jgi:hypothetical protein